MNNTSRVTEAKYILKMIKGVKVGDHTSEIDARFHLLKHKTVELDCGYKGYVKRDKWDKEAIAVHCPRPSISLDVCQRAMPRGWLVYKLRQYEDGTFVIGLSNPNNEIFVYSPALHTMSLTWLHVIIQAMVWEWGQ